LHQLVPGGPSLYDHDSRLDLSFKETLARSWIRFDYLLWEMEGGDNTLLGAPVSNNVDLSGRSLPRLQAVDPVNGPRPLTAAVVPRLDHEDYDGLSGVRGSFGIPTLLGNFESEAWVLQQSTQKITIDPFIDRSIVGSPQTVLGAVTL